MDPSLSSLFFRSSDDSIEYKLDKTWHYSQAPDLQLLDEIIEWIEEPGIIRLPCSMYDLTILYEYVSSSVVDFNFSFRMQEKMGGSDVYRFKQKSFKEVADMVFSFLMDLKEVITVPKLPNEDRSLKKIGRLASFVGFLHKLLTYDSHLSSFGVDGVLKELKFFIAIFSDDPFQEMEDEKVQCLFEQFEGILNRAGTFVHSLVFSPNIEVRKMNECLSEPIELLKANIIEFLEMLPSVTTSKVVVDSFFIIESLLDDLTDLLNGIHGPMVEIKDEIEKLHQGITLSWSLLKEHVEIEEFKEISEQIRDIAYRVEYLICSFMVGDVPIWYFTSSLANVIHHVKLCLKRIQETEEKNNDMALKLAKSFSEHSLVQGMRGTEVDDITVGFMEEEESILEQLFSGEKNLQIISIFGYPGIGKTTMANKIYKNPLIGNRFDKHSWCVVSQTYHRKYLLANILRNLGGNIKNDMDEADMALEIFQSLKDRRYLIVLDDIWNSDVLNDLCSHCFPDDGNNSRILFTSRDRDVAPKDSIMNSLRFFTDDQCWELLQKKIFNGKIALPSELHGIGKKITAKCKGLPLVVVVIAGILSTLPMKLHAWENIEENLDAYIFSNQDKSVMQILNLSYKHLSQQLKPCFLYFGIFEEDTKISVKRLQLLWIAEGLIQKEMEKSKESIAEEYFTKLVKQSLVVVTEKRSDGRAKVCVMHDLLRELCLRIAEEERFFKHVYSDGWKDDQIFQRKIFHSYSGYLQECGLQECGPRDRSVFGATCGHIFVVNMKLLRVLDYQIDLDGCALNGSESLVNLRYLEIRYRVPQLFGNFVNLEYLIVGTKFRISSQIFRMLKLRYLKAGSLILDDDCDVPQANKIEFLSKFYVHYKEDEDMLKSSLNLHRLKCIFKIPQGVDTEPQLFDMSFLTHLRSVSVLLPVDRISIEFPLSIKKLTLERTRLLWEEISVIGALPKLEILKLDRAAFNGETWETRENEFKELRFLKLVNLDLEEWNVSSSEHFPKLQRLFVHSCNNLNKIPNEIGDVATLQLIEVVECRKSVTKSAIGIQQEQQELGNEGLTIHVPEYGYSSDEILEQVDSGDEDLSEIDDNRAKGFSNVNVTPRTKWFSNVTRRAMRRFRRIFLQG